MKKLIATIALVSSMGVAYAAEPVALTDGQMDNVSAGYQASGSYTDGTAFAWYGTATVNSSAYTGADYYGTYAGSQTTSTAYGDFVDSSAFSSSASISF